MSVELYVYAIICQKKWLNIPGRSIGDPLLSKSTHFSWQCRRETYHFFYVDNKYARR